MSLLCRVLEKNEPYSKISILQAMKILVDSCEGEKRKLINRFEKAEINFDVQQAAIVDFDDSFKDLQEKVNELEIS